MIEMPVDSLPETGLFESFRAGADEDEMSASDDFYFDRIDTAALMASLGIPGGGTTGQVAATLPSAIRGNARVSAAQAAEQGLSAVSNEIDDGEVVDENMKPLDSETGQEAITLSNQTPARNHLPTAQDLLHRLGLEKKRRKAIRPASREQSEPLDDPLLCDMEAILIRINVIIKDFSVDPLRTQATLLPPMPHTLRTVVLEMANRYRLGTRSQGTGIDRRVGLVRTPRTALPMDWQRTVQHVLSTRARKESMKIPPAKRPNRAARRAARAQEKEQVRNPPGAKAMKKAAKEQKWAGRPRPGDIVGGNAAPLSEDNPGHRMLLAMGWTPGSSLGVAPGSDGGNDIRLTEPISVVVYDQRRGLGALEQ
ncbi:hypothetical protein DFJ73DRAFT_823960 [Zopfochytrium polystomum]|nr:hypothetical protein DFJ73DRAFT_823960 [Zopfochytrium polystomum]